MEDIFISEQELEQIVEVLHKEYKSDFTDYARTSLRRRISRIKKLFGLNNLEEVKRWLAADPLHLQTFSMEITVNTTEMFRDPPFWNYLRTVILPEFSEYNSIRIWHAGCSSGEEIVSMAIMLHESGLLQRSKIYATDMNQKILEQSAQASYRLKDFKQAKENYINAGGEKMFEEFFSIDTNEFTLKKEFRQAVHYKHHNLAVNEAFTRVDLILCRNVMIYFNAALQSRAVRIFSESLFKGGYLAIGEKENIAFLEEMKYFKRTDPRQKIYKRK